MGLSGRARRELTGIAAFLAAIFIILSIVPIDLTGPIGRFLGRNLWALLGAGAGFVPIAFGAVGLWGFGRIEDATIKRMAILYGGLAVLLPFTIAVLTGVSSGSVRSATRTAKTS